MYCINRELKNGIRSLDSFIDVVFLSVDKFVNRLSDLHSGEPPCPVFNGTFGVLCTPFVCLRGPFLFKNGKFCHAFSKPSKTTFFKMDISETLRKHFRVDSDIKQSLLKFVSKKSLKQMKNFPIITSNIKSTHKHLDYTLKQYRNWPFVTHPKYSGFVTTPLARHVASRRLPKAKMKVTLPITLPPLYD